MGEAAEAAEKAEEQRLAKEAEEAAPKIKEERLAKEEREAAKKAEEKRMAKEAAEESRRAEEAQCKIRAFKALIADVFGEACDGKRKKELEEMQDLLRIEVGKLERIKSGRGASVGEDALGHPSNGGHT